MNKKSISLTNIMHIAAWTWLAYLVALACIDWFIYPQDPQKNLRGKNYETTWN